MVASATCSRKTRRAVELKFAQSEIRSIQQLRSFIAKQHQCMQLSEALGVTEDRLLERLYHSGFNAQNIRALAWLPIAAVAWASPGVSTEEAQAAQLVKLFPLFTCNFASNKLFKTWLREKPTQSLPQLWEDTTRMQVDSWTTQDRQQTGQAILYVAQNVAQASGGWLGFGRVSSAEQRILDRIRSVYGIPAAPIDK